jgi:outer membrane biosynthesis protein TonB
MNTGEDLAAIAARRALPRQQKTHAGATVALSLVVHTALISAVFLAAGVGRRPTPMPEVYHVQLVEPPRRSSSQSVRDAASPLPAAPTEAPSRSETPTGLAPGVSSSLTVDVEDFPFLYYLAAVRNKVSGNWSPPGASDARTVVFFRVYRDGHLAESYLETPSGNVVFDQAALRAVVVSEPFPPLPEDFQGADLGVHFAFQYTLDQ